MPINYDYSLCAADVSRVQLSEVVFTMESPLAEIAVVIPLGSLLMRVNVLPVLTTVDRSSAAIPVTRLAVAPMLSMDYSH